MNLRPRFLLLTLLFFVAVAVPSWWGVRMLAEGIVEQWAVRYAERVVLYDKSRTLQPILREVALSRQLAQSQYLREWARAPDDAELTRRAITEMESFRENFQDQSYFVALRKNGRYYHNNASNEFAGRQLRYVLSPQVAENAWFYDLVRQERDLHINVSPDPALGVTKVWIDVLIRDGKEILGIAGTGLDLGAFIRNMTQEEAPGIASLFVDHGGAIQLHRNQGLIDFASISSKAGAASRKTLDLLFERPQDQAALRQAMQELEHGTKSVATVSLEVGGKRHLAGLSYLPEIDWYEITLMDLDVVLPFSQFSGLLVVYGLALTGALLLFNLALGRYVLRPLTRLDEAMSGVEAGRDVAPQLAGLGSGEIQRLMQRFARMALSVGQARRELESKVQERTQALERLSKTDALTELLNRRGMTERIEAELQRAQREPGRRVGILWVDADGFKQINDGHGHDVGDQALKAIARLITEMLRPYDVASRWGGDEFMVMVTPCDAATLDLMGERLREAAARCEGVRDKQGQTIRLSLSIGGHLAEPGEDLNAVLERGDHTLYAAKAAGRNAYRSSRSAEETLLPQD